MKKIIRVLNFKYLPLILISLVPQLSFGWGEQGHHILCEAATRLVKNENLKNFLQKKNHLMGHLCNIPDINWKREPKIPNYDIINSYSHGMNLDKIYGHIKNVPTDFDEVKQKLHDLNLDPYRKGTLWWRAQQFYSEAIKNGNLAAKSDSKSNIANELLFQMMVNMGLMGHFVGDASMPLHNSADYDAWESGHGGLHAFFETDSVSARDLDLVYDVYSKAKHFDSDLFVTDFLENMKSISVEAFDSIETLLDKDPIKAKSMMVTNPNGTVSKTPGQRETADRGAKV